MKKFGDYLSLLKEYKISKKYLNVNKFILGNSSVDFDSCFGALIYGYIKYVIFNVVYLPLIDCPKSELHLRFDIMFVMQYYKINYTDLYFTEEFKALWNDQNYKDYSIVLYDHNFRQQIFAPSEIIDHHLLKDTRGCQKIIYYNIGSALTLLYYILNLKEIDKFNNEFEGFIKMYDKFFESNQEQKRKQQYDPIIDQIIRCGILLDTYNLNQKQKGIRWNDLDKQAVQNIEKRTKLYNTNNNYKLINLQEVQDAKFDPHLNLKLSLQQLFKKDYKIYKYGSDIIGYSIINIAPQQFISHFGESQILELEMKKLNEQKILVLSNQSISNNNNLIVEEDTFDCHIIMFHYPSENKLSFLRELIVYSKDALLIQRLHDIFKALNMEPKQYNKQGTKKDIEKKMIYFSHFRDPSSSLSRKILEKQISIKFSSKL